MSLKTLQGFIADKLNWTPPLVEAKRGGRVLMKETEGRRFIELNTGTGRISSWSALGSTGKWPELFDLLSRQLGHHRVLELLQEPGDGPAKGADAG